MIERQNIITAFQRCNHLWSGFCEQSLIIAFTFGRVDRLSKTFLATTELAINTRLVTPRVLPMPTITQIHRNKTMQYEATRIIV